RQRAVGIARVRAVTRAEHRRRRQRDLRQVAVPVPRVGMAGDAAAVVADVLLDEPPEDVVAVEGLLIERAVAAVPVAHHPDLALDELAGVDAAGRERAGPAPRD